MKIDGYQDKLKEMLKRLVLLKNALNFDSKKERLDEIIANLQESKTWSNLENTKLLNQERASLEKIILSLTSIGKRIYENLEIIDLMKRENDTSILVDIKVEINDLNSDLEKLEFMRMFNKPTDKNAAFLDIQSGSGGTEAQDWAQMLMRMYLRWGNTHGISTDLVEIIHGEVAGIKSCTIHFKEEYAYGWLRTETGVHRLVRKSPFNSGGRRHTSFSSVFVSPEIDDNIEIEIHTEDLRVDTYRASGAGGQHVNRTDSAVRITHEPSGIVVQCQNSRSQHKNKETAVKQLRSKLYALAMKERAFEKKLLEESKSDISWGSQIRSYILDQSRVKDIRTMLESNDTESVLDGNLDCFIRASLKMGL